MSKQPPEPQHLSRTDSSLRRDAIIEGRVVEDESRAGLEGATVIAKPRASTKQEAVSITDEAGRFRMDVESGHYRLTAFYSDAQAYGEVDATADGVAPLELVISRADVEAAAGLAEEPACRAAADAAPPSINATDALVAAVLQRFLNDRDAIPDGSLLPRKGPAFIVSDADGGLRMTARAIPAAGAGKLALRSTSDLQADANRLGTEVMYIAFHGATISGDCATIGVGVYIMPPKNSMKTYLCCCSSLDIYERKNGRWVFKARTQKICA